MNERKLAREYPGADAERPTEIPARGWVQVVKRAWKESQRDQVPLLAAGVAFYSFLSLFPAMIAAVTIYGLVADPATVARQSRQLEDALPEDAASLITEQMKAISESPQQSLGFGLVIALALAFWSASGGVTNIVSAVNVAYDEEETRGFVKRKALALVLTVGAIVFVLLTVALVAVAPAVLDDLVGSGPVRWATEAIRWAGLLLAVVVALSVVYRFAPDREAPQFRWVSIGAVVATVIWLVASLGFSIFVDNFGNYSKTYGALAGVAVLLLWLWITCLIVLLGAEVNAEAEQQTVRDTTTGDPEPLGRRGAVKADTLPGEEPEAAEERRARLGVADKSG